MLSLSPTMRDRVPNTQVHQPDSNIGMIKSFGIIIYLSWLNQGVSRIHECKRLPTDENHPSSRRGYPTTCWQRDSFWFDYVSLGGCILLRLYNQIYEANWLNSIPLHWIISCANVRYYICTSLKIPETLWLNSQKSDYVSLTGYILVRLYNHERGLEICQGSWYENSVSVNFTFSFELSWIIDRCYEQENIVGVFIEGL